MTRYIKESEICELTQALVKQPTVNPPGDTKECANIIADYFHKNRIEAELLDCKNGIVNVVAKYTGTKSGKTLLLNGHMDVVAPGKEWTVDPFGGEIQDGKMYGRGTCDMKSGIAAMAAAMVGFKRSKKKFNGEIILMAVGDEETGSQFGTRYLLEQKIGLNADFAIVTEPTDLKLELGNRGLRWIDLSITGKACHAGRPHLGINAIEYGARLIDAIRTFKPKIRNDKFEPSLSSLSVTQISGGTQANVIPNQCRITLDRRMLPGETTETVMSELSNIIDSAALSDVTIDIEMRPNFWDPYLISESEPIVQTIKNSYKKIIGKNPLIGTKPACTDGSHLFHIGKIPALLFGPGLPALSHQVNEYVPLRNIYLATDIFIDAFEKLLR
jgi:acetylornithine deacetylase/succinyl-diaminopimelate desuccinylase family protein